MTIPLARLIGDGAAVPDEAAPHDLALGESLDLDGLTHALAASDRGIGLGGLGRGRRVGRGGLDRQGRVAPGEIVVAHAVTRIRGSRRP